MKKLLTLFTLLLTVCSGAWATEASLKTLAVGTTSFKTGDTGYHQWTGAKTKNQVIYDKDDAENNCLMGWSNGNALAQDAAGLKFGNSSKKSAFVFRVGSTSDISVAVAYNNSDVTVSLHYLGTTTDVLTDPNSMTPTGALSSVSLSSSTTTGTLTKSGGAAGYYMVFGTLRFTAESITVTSSTTHTVTYKAGAGTGDDVIDNKAASVADCPGTFTAPSGKAFSGWNTKSDGSGTSYAVGASVTEDLTLFAQWDNVYTVTFNLQGHGDAIVAQNIINGGKVTEPTAPTADGWVFGGWYKEEGCTNVWDFDTDVVSANTEIFAKWTEYVAPTAGIIYSADATATWSVSASTDETPYYEIPSTKAAISGGKMYVHNGQSGAKDLIASNYSTSFCFTNNNTNFKIVLNDPLAEGDVITCKSAATSTGCGVAVTATETLNGGTSEIHLAADNGSLNTDTYVVDAEDELCGKRTIYLYRYGGKTTYIGEFTITRNNSITLNNVGGAANGFSTFCSPNNFTVSGATAYKASIADNKLTLTEVTGVIPANAGVVLAGTTGATATIAYTNNTATADMEGNDLKGTTARVLTSTLKGEYAHFLAFQKTTNTFKEYNGTNFPANKAYVVTNDAPSREFEMIFGDQDNNEQGTETDGIAGVEAEKNANVAYNLAGQKVGADYKGIVIVNGKKVIRK